MEQKSASTDSESLRPILIDYKTRAIVRGVKTLAWPEHCQQLAAYGKGLDLNNPRLINVFVGIEDQEIKIVEWSKEDAERGWAEFKCLLRYWQITKNWTNK